MNTLQKILVFAVALGVIVTGTLGILIVLDITSFAESRESLIRVLSGIAIGTIVAVIIFLLSRFVQSNPKE